MGKARLSKTLVSNLPRSGNGASDGVLDKGWTLRALKSWRRAFIHCLEVPFVFLLLFGECCYFGMTIFSPWLSGLRLEASDWDAFGLYALSLIFSRLCEIEQSHCLEVEMYLGECNSCFYNDLKYRQYKSIRFSVSLCDLIEFLSHHLRSCVDVVGELFPDWAFEGFRSRGNPVDFPEDTL